LVEEGAILLQAVTIWVEEQHRGVQQGSWTKVFAMHGWSIVLRPLWMIC
jgi:hypothetical protein